MKAMAPELRMMAHTSRAGAMSTPCRRCNHHGCPSQACVGGLTVPPAQRRVGSTGGVPSSSRSPSTGSLPKSSPSGRSPSRHAPGKVTVTKHVAQALP